MTILQNALKLSGGGIVSLVGAGGKTSLMTALADEFFVQGQSVLITTTTKIERPEAKQTPVLVIEEDSQKLIARCSDAVRRQALVTAAAGCRDGQRKLFGHPPDVLEDVWRSGLFKWIVVEADGAARRPVKAPADHEPVIPGGSKWVIGLVGLLGLGKPFSEKWVFRPEHYSRISGLHPEEPVSPASVAAVASDPHGLMKGAPVAAKKSLFLNQADNAERTDYGREISDLLNRAPNAFERVVIGRLRPAPQVVECYDFSGKNKDDD